MFEQSLSNWNTCIFGKRGVRKTIAPPKRRRGNILFYNKLFGITYFCVKSRPLTDCLSLSSGYIVTKTIIPCGKEMNAKMKIKFYLELM